MSQHHSEDTPCIDDFSAETLRWGGLTQQERRVSAKYLQAPQRHALQDEMWRTSPVSHVCSVWQDLCL